jgi:LacI family transcriptional regulator
VSHQTVSRFLKGEGIKPRNRESITSALRELDYRPNMAARSLATQKSRRIAVLTQGIDKVGPARILQGANALARRLGYLLDVITLDVSDRGTIDVTINEVNGQDVAGILALASTDEMIAAFTHAEFRVPAYVDADPGHRNTRGMELIVDHLVELGHRRFFHVAGPRTWTAASNRELAYEHALARHGLVSTGTAYGDWSAASGYAIASSISSARPVVATAFVAANDQMALGVVRGLTLARLRVPEDVSVTGFDDIPEAEFFSPPLTTVRLDFEEQGREALRRLLAHVEGNELPASVMSVELMRRDSTGPLPVTFA